MMSENKIPSPVSGALLASGFPFQTAIAALIKQTSGWNLIEEEFPWKDSSGNDQFIDVVAGHESIVAVVECRKTHKDNLIFLEPPPEKLETDRILSVYTTQISDSTRRLRVYLADWEVEPESAESKFCVVSTSTTGRDFRMLEPDAQKLLRSTQAYAQYRRSRFQPSEATEADRLYLPLLVTNAGLWTARYDPGQVSLETGEFLAQPDVQPAKWVRFRKTFSAESVRESGYRTVLVVNATALKELLGMLKIAGGPTGVRFGLDV